MMMAMHKPVTSLYGIRNCDTVKRARSWLDEHQVPYVFHDFKTQGVPAERLDHWLAHAGWEKLLNRNGTTWRRLDPTTQATAQDERGAVGLRQGGRERDDADLEGCQRGSRSEQAGHFCKQRWPHASERTHHQRAGRGELRC